MRPSWIGRHADNIPFYPTALQCVKHIPEESVVMTIWQMDDGFYSCVAVVAGSNTRFYHTCEVISSTLIGLACRIEHTSLGLVS